MSKTVLGILAHVDAGKTTLSESILYLTGSIRKLGRVDNKDAFLDTYSLERERGITIFSKQAEIEMRGRSYTLLDTPGHVDFSAEMERTLQVLDSKSSCRATGTWVRIPSSPLYKLRLLPQSNSLFSFFNAEFFLFPVHYPGKMLRQVNGKKRLIRSVYIMEQSLRQLMQLQQVRFVQ